MPLPLKFSGHRKAQIIVNFASCARSYCSLYKKGDFFFFKGIQNLGLSKKKKIKKNIEFLSTLFNLYLFKLNLKFKIDFKLVETTFFPNCIHV